jgi:hypothetical protein
MRRLIKAVMLLAGLVLLSGCAGEQRPAPAVSTPEPTAEASAASAPAKASGTLGAVQGHWVDLNGDHTLDIDGEKLTLSSGEWSDTYQFEVERQGSYEYLVGEAPEGFGIMSDLRVCDDGTLEAYEMVLDGPSYTYKFMREEDLAAALAAEDRSDPDAPKEIESEEIEYFSLTFDLRYLRYDLGDEWKSGFYSWQIERRDEGYVMDFSISGDSYMVAQFHQTVDQDYVDGLAALIREQNLAGFNGYYMTNAVNKPGYYLYVEYASGETLTIAADGDPGDTCVFALAPLLDYAAKQDIQTYD